MTRGWGLGRSRVRLSKVSASMLVFGLALLLIAVVGPWVTIDGTQVGKGAPWWVQVTLAAAGALVIGWALLASRDPDQQLRAGSGFLGAPPRLPARLVARPELSERLVTALQSGAESVAVTGIGGAGKSTLAAQACRDPRVQARFKDGVTWLDAGPGKDPVILLADLATRLGLPGAEATFGTVSQGRDRIAASQAGKRVLIALDNVWEREPVDAMIGLAPGFSVIFTSRLPDTALTFGSAEVGVDQLSGEQALELLARWASLESAQLAAQGRDVCARVGNLALGVAIAGALTARGRSLPDVLALIKEDPSVNAMDPPYPYATLFAAIRAGISDLPEAHRHRYEQLAVFARSSPFPGDAAAVLWQPELSAAETADLLADLVGRSLLSRAGEGWYTAHDLQYELLSRELGPERLAKAHARLLDGYRAHRYSDWAGAATDPYLGRALAGHLGAAGRDSELAALLSDMTWITGRLTEGQLQGLMADYGYSAEGVATQIGRALRLSAHVLATSPWLARSQLAGRLLGHPDPRVAAWAAALAASNGSQPWLAPLGPSLTPTTTALRQVLTGHARWVLSVTVTANGSLAASGGTDGTIRLWDLQTGSARAIPGEHGGAVTALALSPGGHSLVSGGDDDVLRIWDPSTGQLKTALDGEGGATSALAVAEDGMTAVSSGDGGPVRVWDMAGGQQRAVLAGHADRVRGLAVTPDGKRAVSGGRDGTLRVWDLTLAQQEMVLTGHDGSVLAVAVTASGGLAVTGGGDGTVRVWDLTAQCQRGVLTGHAGGVLSVAVAADGTRAASAGSDGTVRVWDLPAQHQAAVLTGHDGWVRSVAMTRDGRTVVTGGGDGTVRVWDLAGASLDTAAGQDSGAAWAVAVAARAAVAFTSSSDGALQAWDLTAARKATIFPGHGAISSLAAAAGGSIAVSGGGDGAIYLLDLTGSGNRTRLGSHSWAWPVVTMTDDGTLAASGGGDGFVRVWDLATKSEMTVLTGHRGGVSAVAMAADGTLAVSGGEDGTVRAWDLSTGHATVHTGHHGWVSAVAVSTDGKLAISGGEDATVRAWDIATGRPATVLAGHKGAVRSVALLPREKLAISGGDDGTVRIWDLTSGTEQTRWAGEYAVLSCAGLSTAPLRICVGERRRQPYVLELRNHP